MGREVLLLIASLSTHDPREIRLDDVLKRLQENRICVSVISVSPEMFVLKQICGKTGGTYSVALNGAHFQELLESHIKPPLCPSDAVVPELILMGFPCQDDQHVEQDKQCFVCPRCNARVREVPGSCPVCDLPLTSGPLLSRSFQHLFPMPALIKTKASGTLQNGRLTCGGCELSM